MRCHYQKHVGALCPNAGKEPLNCDTSCPLDVKSKAVEGVRKKCIILNGPPGCGKDTIAKLLVEQGFSKFENKAPMFDVALAMTGIDRKKWFRRYNNREKKELPWDELNGMSCREFMIWISEDVMKPRLGDNIFGKLAAKAALATPGSVVFSDGGFQSEMKCLQDAFGKENVLLVHLFRDGYSFDTDSRNYLKPEGSHYFPLHLISNMPNLAATDILLRVKEMDVAE